MRLLCLLVLITLFSCKDQGGKQSQEIDDTKTIIVKTIKNPAGLDAQTPNLFSSDDGLWMSWLEAKDEIDFLKFSNFKNNRWEEVQTVTSGNDWFVNWADFPAIAVNDNQVLTNILKMSDTGTYTYDVRLNLLQTVKRSDQSDLNPRKRNFLLHNDGTKSEHGFVSLKPYGDTSFYAVWLDGRNTGGGMDHDNHSSEGGAMTLRGAVVSENGSISREEELDNRVCDCCQTDLAVTENNQIITAYRDRSEDEIRDIKIKKWDETSGWSKPISVGNDNWKIAGCPVNGPALAVYNNAIAIAWYTGANGQPKVQLSFGDVNEDQLDTPVTINTNPTIGRIDVLMISETAAVVSWIENVGDDTLIQLLKVHRDGNRGEILTISKTNAARASGFPRMALIDDNVMIAFTGISKDESSRIETKIVAIDAL